MIELINHAIALKENLLGEQQQLINNRNYRDVLSPIHYAKEFGTIHLNAGRCTGKTTAMTTLARKGDLIIVGNEDTKRRLIYENPHCLATFNSIYDVVLGSKGLRSYCMPPRVFEWVWIDDPLLCERSGYKIDHVYELTRANLYIKLGE